MTRKNRPPIDTTVSVWTPWGWQKVPRIVRRLTAPHPVPVPVRVPVRRIDKASWPRG